MKRAGLVVLILSAAAFLAQVLSAGYCVSPYIGEEGEISRVVSPDNAAIVALFSMLGALLAATGLALWCRWRGSPLPMLPAVVLLVLSIAQLYLVDRRSACISLSGFGSGAFVMEVAGDGVREAD